MRSGVILTLVGIAASSLPAAAAPSDPPKSISIEESHDMGIDLDHLRRSREHGNHYDLLGGSSGMVTADTDSQNHDQDFYEQAHKYHSAYKDYYANHYEGPKGIARARAYFENSALKLRDLQKELELCAKKGYKTLARQGIIIRLSS